MTSERDKYIDFLKGSAIFLVVAGHVLQGPIDQNFPRYIIYYFHMPFMFALSGFVLRAHHFNMCFKQLIKKYWHRLLMPWFIASIFYNILFNCPKAIEAEIIFKHIIYMILHPWYHLWYIPSLFIMVVGMKIFYNRKTWLILTFTCVVSIASLAMLNNYVNMDKINLRFLLGNKYTYDYFFFFALGVVIRKYKDNSKNQMKLSKHLLGITFIIFLLIGIGDFGLNFNPIISAINRLITNTLLILFLLNSTINTNLLGLKEIIAFWGKISLPIYLWHILPIILCDTWLKNRVILIQDKFSTALYYLIVMVFIAIVLSLLLILQKQKKWFPKKALLGL